jgi:hypothetical protein
MRRPYFFQSAIFIFLFFALSAHAWAKTVTLTWDASPSDVDGYYIYHVAGSSTDLSHADNPTMIDVGADLTYTFYDLEDDVEHSFAVTAYDDSGNESAYSNIVTSDALDVGSVDSSTVSAGETKDVTLSWDASPSDVDGYNIYYVAGSEADLEAANNPSTVNVGNVLTYTLTGLDGTVEHSFAVTAYASGNESSYSNIVLSEALTAESPVNSAPILASIGDRSIIENGILAFTLSASDTDGDSLDYSVSNLPSGASFSAGSFRWVPSFTQAGSYSTQFTVSDGSESDSETITITVTNNNRAPVLTTIGSKSVSENTPLTFTLSATDADDDLLGYGVSGLPSGASFSTQSGLFSWTPSYSQYGSYTLVFSVSDGVASDTETVTISVANTNQSPILNTIGAKTGAEGAPLRFNVSATDGDDEVLLLSASGLPEWASFSSDGDFSWTPTTTQAGSYSVVFSASDSVSNDSETVLITINNTNQAPILETIGTKSGAEESLLSFKVIANDVDNDTLSYSASGLPDGATFTEDGVFSWTPTTTQADSYSVVFSVSDGSSATDSETVAISIGNTNHAPVLASIGNQSFAEGTSLTFTISAVDADSDALEYSASGVPDGATFDAVQRQFRWTTDYDSSSNNRVFPVTFTATDGVSSDSETVTITIIDVNRAPLITALGTFNLTAGEAFDLDIEASDPDGDTLTYSANNLPDGSVFVPLTRTFSWIPSDEQSGRHEITFVVSDGQDSVADVAFFIVEHGNEAPVLTPIGGQRVAEGSELTFTLTAADANEDSLTYAVSGLPEGALFNSASHVFSWTPDYADAGTYAVDFSVSDGVLSDYETVEIVVSNTNQAPLVSGSPETSLMATTSFGFTPEAIDPDGDSLTFSIVNRPTWATFNSVDGSLKGIPGESDIGSTADIIISVSDGSLSTALEPFTLSVGAFVYVDSDGDGIPDDQDAFPSDAGEWIDTDGDAIGDNADSDDDNDGIADSRDGAPLDASTAGWIISAVAGDGGYISPDGDTSVLYGGTQAYTIASMEGYYLYDIQIDGYSIDLVDEYTFENVSQHHSIEAQFIEIPQGLSVDPTDAGLLGIERVDGGSDVNNHVDEKPKMNLDFRFRVKLKESISESERKVYLVLDGYRYLMDRATGTLADGADYIYTTRLGPAFEHNYYYLAEDVTGVEVWRYPSKDVLPGPVIELMNGRNIVGMPVDVNAYAIESLEAFGDETVYRWIPDLGFRGGYQRVDSGAPVTTGEGYIIRRAMTAQLPDIRLYGEVEDGSYLISVQAGWNLISNPYGGNVDLADVQVMLGNGSTMDWLSAVAENLVIDMMYSYLGADWGGRNEFSSATGSQPAVLIPWIGYWIYVNSSDVSLVIDKPLH